MTLLWVDHLFFLLLVFVLPVVDYFSIRRRKALIEAGRTEHRMKLYRNVQLEEWAAVVVLLAYWFSVGREASGLGLVIEIHWRAWVGYALAAGIGVALLLQARSVIGSTENRGAFRRQMGALSYGLPHTRRERTAFDRVSMTAGICEEVLGRGFVIAYVIALLGVPFWAAALLSSVFFGLAHSYQGPIGALRSGVVGLVLATLYGLTGSIWASIVVHVLMDVSSGRMGFAVLSERAPDLPAKMEQPAV